MKTSLHRFSILHFSFRILHFLAIVIPGGFATAVSAADFPPPYNTEPASSGSPMDPEQAAASMKLPPGFQCTLVAAEPQVQNPIAMAWDHRGRMWVAENYTYADRAMRFDLSLRDRVLIFEDQGNGKWIRKIFTDQVQMLTSVEVGRGGVWLMCPPQLLFIPDRNGDDQPDGPPEIVLDGFEVGLDNYHNFANGLRWGPDGWLYGRCGHSCPGNIGPPGTRADQRIPLKGGVWRYHPERKIFETLTQGTTNPWGHDWDRHGEGFFINTVNGHLWHLIPGAHFKESFGLDPNPLVYDRLDTHADHYHFDKGGEAEGAAAKAAMQGGATTDTLGGGHSHIGCMIYQADQWPPEFRNKLYTLNQHGQRANCDRLERLGSGYVGKHEPDFFKSTDPFFRGIEISTGPDGSAYVLDWSDAGECHEANGVHRTSGRIFKITYAPNDKPAGTPGTPGTPAAPGLADLQNLTAESVPRLLRHPNVWFERQCRQQLADLKAQNKVPPGVADALRQMLAGDTDEVLRLHALWSLHVLEEAPDSLLLPLLGDPNEHLRIWAIRLLSEFWRTDTIAGKILVSSRLFEKPDSPQAKVLQHLPLDDESALVRLTLASTLQRLPFEHRVVRAYKLAHHAEDAEDHNLSSIVWYGLGPVTKISEKYDDRLYDDIAESRWPQLNRWIARAVAEQLAEKDPERLGFNVLTLGDLLFNAASLDQPLRLAALQGVHDGLRGFRKAPRPASWEKFARTFTDDPSPETQSILRDISVVFGDGRSLEEVKKVALDKKADPSVRQSALKTLVDQKPEDLRSICEKMIEDRVVNLIAAQGLSTFDDPAAGKLIAAGYRRFLPGDRPAVIAVLVARPSFAAALLNQIAAGKIPRSDLTAFYARQILALNSPRLTAQLAEVWGELRNSTADKRLLIDKIRLTLSPETLAQADLSKGRLAFATVCAACHTLYGEGGKIGPDLTGSGRYDLGYLLDNIVDPGAVVGADFRMWIITLKDGRVLAGMIAAENDKTLTLRLPTEQVTLDKEQIVKRDASPMSMMPEGLLLTMSPEQIRDLIAYLMSPRQVPLPR